MASTFSLYGPKARLGAILAAAAFLGTQVPKELFDKFGWDYETYRTWLFFAVVAVLAYVAFTVRWWLTQGSFLNRNVLLMTAVLGFLSARLPEAQR